MANGYVVNLLKHIAQVAGGATPSNKITPTGFLQGLIENGGTPQEVINQGTMDASGHVRDMKIKIAKRGVEQDVVDTDDCDIEVVPSYTEATVSLDYFSKMAIFISDDVIAKYEQEASQSVIIGQPATPFMREHLDSIVRQLTGFFQKVDDNLMGAMATNFGVNIRTGLSTASTLNISKDLSVSPLGGGIGRIIADAQLNEMSGVPWIVGAGNMHLYEVEQMAKGINNFGVDTSKFQNAYKFFYDPKAVTKWGANHIGVFEPGSVLLLERNRNLGFKAGEKGTSFFFTMTPPLVDSIGSKHLGMFRLDCQLKYYDCPTEVNVGYTDVPTTIDRGWVLTVSKPYGLWTLPAGGYDASDRLYGANGTLRYNVTNTCETC